MATPKYPLDPGIEALLMRELAKASERLSQSIYEGIFYGNGHGGILKPSFYPGGPLTVDDTIKVAKAFVARREVIDDALYREMFSDREVAPDILAITRDVARGG